MENLYREVGSVKNNNFLLYSLPSMGTNFLIMPVVVVQGIYAKHFGLALTTIASVILLARLFDALSDPVVGYLSDRYMNRTGTRKPFILMGGILLIFSGYFLYVPPDDVTAVYFGTFFIALYLGWTLFEIPHMAWVAELTQNSSERAKFYSFRQLAGYIGAIIFFSIPLLPIFETTDVTPDSLKFSVIAVCLVMVPLLYLCIKNVPNGHWLQTEKTDNHRAVFYSIVRNRPLLIFTGVFLFLGAGAGMWFSMLFIFIDGYLGLGDKFIFVYMFGLSAGTFSTLIWYKCSGWFGKKQSLLVGTLMIVVAFTCTGFLGLGEWTYSLLVCLMILGSVGFSAMGVLGPPLLTEIVDYGSWKFGSDRSGTYFSVYTLLAKVTGGLGGALGFSIAGVYGFDLSSTVHSPDSVFGLRLAAAYVPAAITLLSVGFLAALPINEKRYAIIRRRLTVVQARSKRLLHHEHARKCEAADPPITKSTMSEFLRATS